MRVVLVLLLVVGCGDNLPPDRSQNLALHDEIFASDGDRGVLCAANGDDHGYPIWGIRAALDRARDRGEIAQLFVHDPGGTISRAKLEAILWGAADRGLRFVTYRELADGATRGPGLALGFDDWSVDDWGAARDLIDKYSAHVTFFAARYPEYTAAQKETLHAFVDDGSDVEYHGTYHLDAVSYVDQNGMAPYLSVEIAPGLAAMRADGFDPIVFAYPAGLRTPELDSVLLEQFAAVRATTLHCPHGDE
ncbi:MAG TPA: polysaccharide deacetylase family protein [Kofleriaceae bacterium]|nr:polysaccharide deacetylase family protein [Kofleriaceae bacterium]